MTAEAKLEVKLFGSVTFLLNGQPVKSVPTRAAQALLVYLLHQPHPVERERLVDMFYQASTPKQAAANLRSTLSRLRKELALFLVITRRTVGVAPDANIDIDSVAFATLAAAEEWETALSLYQGDFLDGFYLREAPEFEAWVLLERERLRLMAVQGLQTLVAMYQQQGDYWAGLQAVTKLLGIEPLLENAHRVKMLLLARSGQQQAALTQYKTCRVLLQDELGVAPGPETAALAERIRRAGEVPRHNLPAPPTPLIGRERELDALNRQLIDPACRLLTIIGPGGMGKTRLALAGARRFIPTGYFLNGIHFVSLVDAPTPEDIPGLIAAAVGITFQGDAPPAEQVAAALADEEMLLVLDNLEHLMEDGLGDETAAFLDKLLTAAPLVTLLVTTRRRLYLREERLFDLHGLDLPAEAGREVALQSSAVQLFLQTGVSQRRHFQPTGDDVAAMVDICRTLAGLPLGIELAAAWLRQMTCPEIAQTLHTGMDLLKTSLRNVPDRHRSLMAVFNHSWQLLAEAERQIFARLSLFRGGFTAEAAQAVADATPADLDALIDHSLLRRESGRYTLHDLLRQYAAGRLAQFADGVTLSERHADFYLDFLAAQSERPEMDRRQAIRAELLNIRAAWLWTAVHGEPDALLPAAATLHDFYSAESSFHEGIRLFAETFRAASLSPLLRADLQSRKARMHIHIGQISTAKRELDEAVHVLHQAEDPVRYGTVLGYVAITAFYAGEFEQAVALAEESLDLAVNGGDVDGQAFAASFLGSCHKALGNYEEADDFFQRSVVLYEQLEDDLGRAMTLNNLGNLAQAQGEYADAQAYYLTCSDLFRRLDHPHGAATTLANAGRLARKLGDLTEAAALLGESLEMKRAQQDGRGTAVALIGLADVSVAVGNGATARDHLHEGLVLAQQAGDVKLALEGVAVAGALAAQIDGDARQAARLLAFVSVHPALTQEVREQVVSFRATFTAEEWETAVDWVDGQTLESLIDSIIAST